MYYSFSVRLLISLFTNYFSQQQGHVVMFAHVDWSLVLLVGVQCVSNTHRLIHTRCFNTPQVRMHEPRRTTDILYVIPTKKEKRVSRRKTERDKKGDGNSH